MWLPRVIVKPLVPTNDWPICVHIFQRPEIPETMLFLAGRVNQFEPISFCQWQKPPRTRLPQSIVGNDSHKEGIWYFTSLSTHSPLCLVWWDLGASHFQKNCDRAVLQSILDACLHWCLGSTIYCNLHGENQQRGSIFRDPRWTQRGCTLCKFLVSNCSLLVRDIQCSIITCHA